MFIKVIIELIEKIHFAFGGLVLSLGIHSIKVVIEFSNDFLLADRVEGFSVVVGEVEE